MNELNQCSTIGNLSNSSTSCFRNSH